MTENGFANVSGYNQDECLNPTRSAKLVCDVGAHRVEDFHLERKNIAVRAEATDDGECASLVTLDNVIQSLDVVAARLDAALLKLEKFGVSDQQSSDRVSAPRMNDKRCGSAR